MPPRDDPGLDAAEHRRDAGEVRGRDDREPEDRGEGLPRDDALAVGEETAGDPGDERRDREAHHLHEDDVDADPGRGSLVRADREHRRAERARPQLRDAERDDDQHDEAHEPELPPWEFGTTADAEVPAEQLRRLHVVAERLRRSRCCGTRSPRCRPTTRGSRRRGSAHGAAARASRSAPRARPPPSPRRAVRTGTARPSRR